MSWKLVYTQQALKDAKRIAASGLKNKVQPLLALLEKDPLRTPAPFEKLIGDLVGLYSRRINIQRRIVSQVYRREKVIKIIRMWTHYE